MLVYLDNGSSLRVYRTTDTPGAPRTFIGRIHKTNFEFVIEKDAEPVSEEEDGDIGDVIQICKDAHRSRLKSEALNFPEMARRVAEFYASSTSDVEKRLIATAVQQIAKAIRRADQGADANKPAARTTVEAS